uniref:Tyrosine-protein kinase ephrin type A/B receptor-like domain-containing protein n=1 Tax=Amphimedon queenslandica TaxID=400682 RepID=A0A1X7U8B4_AMPQE
MSISAKDDQGQDVTSNLVLHATSSAPREVSVDTDINYISNNEIILYQHNTSVTNATITLGTIGEVAQQVQVKINVELVECPPGLTLDSTGKCSCSGDFADRVECSNLNFSSFILRGFWIGEYQYNGNTDIVVGHCRNCKYTTNSEGGRLPLGESFAEVEDFLCGPFQTGVLCSGCTEGYAPAFNTDEFHCVKCDDKHIIWGIVLFILLDIIFPFVLLVAIFVSDVPLTSGLLHGPILFGQMITTVIPLDGDGIITYQSIFHQGATEIAEKVYSIFYDLFNIEFFMSLQNYCVSKDISYAGIIALQYLSAYLPFVFVVLVAIVFYCNDANFKYCRIFNCRKPSCLEKFSWAKSFEHTPNALATFILLSYTKIAVITGYLLTPASLWTANGSTSYNGKQVMCTISYCCAFVSVLLPC